MQSQKPNDPNAREDHRRLVMAVLVSLLILIGYRYFYEDPMLQKQHDAQVARQMADQKAHEGKTAQSGADSATGNGAAAVPNTAAGTDAAATGAQTPDAAPAAVADDGKLHPRADVLAREKRVPIEGDHLMGSLPLVGGRLDDVLLKDHYVDLEKKEHVALLSPSGTAQAFFTESGWLSGENGVALPGAQTRWTLSPASAQRLTSGGKPVVLQWDNGQGLVFTRSVSLDKDYLFTITQSVTNNSPAPVTLNAYHTVARNSLPPDYSGFYSLHEGPVGYMGGKGYEPQYKSLDKGDTIDLKDTSGWLGITDKYWLVATLPKPKQKFNAHVFGSKNETSGAVHYQADAVDADVRVAPGKTETETSYLYAGAKELHLIHDYQDKYGFTKLEYGIDFGMWYLITKPFYYLLHWLISTTGNVAVGMLLMTLVIRGLMFPLASKSFRAMAKMRVVGPRIKELQEIYKDDRTKLQMEIYALYQKEDVNPFSGCFPMFVQIPVFFALYKVILISVDLRHAPFWGWIRDLSAPDPTSVFNLFGLIHWTPPAPLMIGAWPVIYCITMVMQRRLSPPMTDPAQEKLQTYFPFFITVMMAHFAVGLVIYWCWSNVLSMVQQYYILRKHGGQETSLLFGHSERRGKKKAAKEKTAGGGAG
ncbi:MAG: membrane protein insertase YidC [Alphaproteobacteria bacterium]|nr:membrane protein insertase YidC [Alphaproteobacteria bacterium]